MWYTLYRNRGVEMRLVSWLTGVLFMGSMIVTPLFAEKRAPPLEASMQIQTEQVTPGQPIDVTLQFEVADGWLLGPWTQDAVDDNAMVIHWQLPEGVQVLAVEAPPPRELIKAGLPARGYEHHAQLKARLMVPADYKQETLTVGASVDWVVCGKTCVPGTSDLSAQSTLRKEALIGQALAGAQALSHAAAPAAQSPVSMSWIWLGLLALAGGLCLNFMPCVLPVLSLKLFSLIQLREADRRQVTHQILAFVSGVLVSFLALGAVFVGLREAGEALGWGFQLQSPLFVGGLTVVMFLMGLGLMGLYEMNLTPRHAQGAPSHSWWGGIASGILTTLVATPCTGPFLGSALAVGLTLPAMGQLALMLLIGLGMSSPFLLVLLFPKALRWLPKPGRWMIYFKIAMGGLLLVSALWLAWVFHALTSTSATAWMIGACLLGAGAVYAIGRFQMGKGFTLHRTRLHSTLFLGAAVWTLWYGTTLPVQETDTMLASSSSYSRHRVEEILAQGRPVLVDFTARWCLLCQANRPTLHSDSMQNLLAGHDVVLLEADLTQRQPALMAELRRLGREGVPAYVLLSPDHEPIWLPEVVTVTSVEEALAEISGRPAD